MSIERREVTIIRVTPSHEGQRLDNFLFRELKGLPRTRVYRLIRRGEVRVNKKRCKPDLKLCSGDELRIPPVAIRPGATIPRVSDGLAGRLLDSVLHETDLVLVLNKPAGISVHGGSGVRLALVDALRQIRPEWSELELAHRLDRDTSGCLLLAKKSSALKHLQREFKLKRVRKRYLAFVHGSWPKELIKVDVPLLKNEISSGERVVKVSRHGKEAETHFKVLQTYAAASLIEASPITGRTHQIRVHCQHAGYSIIGDQKYGTKGCSEQLKSIKTLCLHASNIEFSDLVSNKIIKIEAPFDKFWQIAAETLEKKI
ncbi:MAG: RluA family pseudouridine synthase [Gammaproteobacteria bacterium]|nr:RluA family pseudouridine synthase [Gammaproteobacteria bacterium]